MSATQPAAHRLATFEPFSTVGHVDSIEGSVVTCVLSRKDASGAAFSPTEELQIGGLVKMKTTRADVFGFVVSLRTERGNGAPADDRWLAAIQLLGEILHGTSASDERTFTRGVSTYPGLGSPIYTTTGYELSLVYAPPRKATAKVGTLFQDPTIPAYVVTDDMLGKHFAVLGTTGSGKSCAVALVLKAILSRHDSGHVVLLDSHNEYASAFGAKAEVITPEDLQIPYWLMNFEESVTVLTSGSAQTLDVEAAILKNAIIESKRKYAANGGSGESITVDTPVPYRLTDLTRYIDMKMGELDKPTNSIPYLRIKSRIEDLTADNRLAFMFPGHHLRDNMVEIISRLLRMPVDGKPLTILDLSGLPAEILDVIVSVVCRMIFDFAVWSDPAKMEPILLICEEAHRYIPEAADAGFGPTKKVVSRIAKEGRKYGLSLCLVSQRPSELSASVLSQCNTIFALRMSNDRDQEFVRNALPDNAQGFTSALPTLGTQEAIVIGEGVTVPTRLRFDKLPPGQQPRSRTAAFSDAWQSGHADPDAVAQTVARWRNRIR